jgi:thioredoxin reductase
MTYHEYIIIGAGPAGLQLGYFLQKAGRDYLILEANETAGSFFAAQPRYRRLISLNKRYNFYGEDDFNMRHDWNSLLTDDFSHLFQEYSDKLYPNAAELHQYLMDYAQRNGLCIQYNTRICHIDRPEGLKNQFYLVDTEGREYMCSQLLMATGAVREKVPTDIEGIELADTYTTHSTDPEDYANKRVLIIGRGNSAFEVANRLAGHAAIIHIAIGNRPLNLAWQTHFAGDLRSINNTIIDMFQLKALHAILGFNVKKIVRNDDDTYQVDVIEEVPHWKTPGFFKQTHNYERVICCTGWQYVDPDLFGSNISIGTDAKGKYPLLNASWESTEANLFFIGTTMAARDKQSASSVIHGFRYNIRTLFHILEHRYHAVPFLSQSFDLRTEQELKVLAEFVLERASRSDALHPLFGFLCDVLVFGGERVQLFCDLPVAYVLEQPEFTKDKDIALVTLEFGFHHYPPGTDILKFITYSDEESNRACGALLHPVFRHYADGTLVAENHLGESLVGRYGIFRGGPEDLLNEHEDVYTNILMNAINQITCTTSRKFSEEIILPESFIPASAENPLSNKYGLPICMASESDA